MVSCGDPGKVHHADWSITNFTYGNEVRYDCHTGYALMSGNLTRTCSADGNWTQSPPVCEGMYHKTLIEIKFSFDFADLSRTYN